MSFAIGKKLGMTTIYTEDGAQNVTLVEVVPNTIDKLRTAEKDGYTAVCLSMPKTAKKDFKKEFVIDDTSAYEVGKQVTAETFEEGQKVRLSAPAKGKGFQGVVKRHGFAGGPASHGHRHALRSPGSIGSAFPQHVVKGKRMAGRMGGKRSTSGGLKIVLVDAQKGIIGVKGAVPGVAGRVVEIVSI